MSNLGFEASNLVQQAKPDFPKAKPKGVVVSPHQTKLYVSTGSGNMIATLDADTRELPGSVKVGRRVWAIALTRDRSRLCACDGVRNTLPLVDTASLTVAASIEVGEAQWGGVIDD